MGSYTGRMPPKDPNAELTYTWDWATRTNGFGGRDWLATGETISSFTIDPDTGITVESSSITDSGTSVTAKLSGGTVNTQYRVTCHIVTSAGNEDDRTIVFTVEER